MAFNHTFHINSLARSAPVHPPSPFRSVTDHLNWPLPPPTSPVDQPADWLTGQAVSSLFFFSLLLPRRRDWPFFFLLLFFFNWTESFFWCKDCKKTVSSGILSWILLWFEDFYPEWNFELLFFCQPNQSSWNWLHGMGTVWFVLHVPKPLKKDCCVPLTTASSSQRHLTTGRKPVKNFFIHF